MRVVDLFAGAGGLSHGFKSAGYNLVSAYEYWDLAANVYEKNHEHKVNRTDLSEFNNYSEISELKPDIIIGGPPCQDYSSAGKRDEGLGRASLTIKFAEIICNIKPKYFLMENVPLIEKSPTYNKAKKMFSDAGYGLSSIVIDASRCGVPQKRKRFILFGTLRGKNDVLIPFIEKSLSLNPMTVRDYLGVSLGVEHYYRHPRSYARRGVFSIDEPAPTVRGVNRPIPAGYKGHPTDTAPVTENIRALTTLERSLLQTFPSDYFSDEIPKTHLEQMIGNAVPPKLGEFIGKAIKEYVENEKIVVS